MKKTALVLAVLMILSLVACTGKTEQTKTPTTSTKTEAETSVPTTSAPTSSAPETSAKTEEPTADPTGAITGEKDEKAIELYKSASEKFAKAETFAYVMKMTMKMDLGGISLDTEATNDVKVENKGKDNEKVRAISKAQLFGMDIVNDEYYEGGWKYVTSEDGNYKVEETYDFSGDFEGSAFDFSSADCDVASITDNSDGTKTVIIVVTGENVLKLMGEEGGAENVKDAEIRLEMVVNKDGLPTKIVSSVKMTAEEDGATSPVDAKNEFVISYTGFKVEAPEGYKDYEEQEIPDWDFDTDADWTFDLDFDFEDMPEVVG